MPNPFTPDIRVLFAKEFSVAQKGREIIREMTGNEITDDEVGFITLHIHAGLSDEQVSVTLNTTRIINEGISMIEKAFGQHFDTDSLAVYPSYEPPVLYGGKNQKRRVHQCGF